SAIKLLSNRFPDNYDFSILNNTFTNNSGTAIDWTDSTDVKVKNNVILNNGWTGIALDWVTNSLVKNNTLINNTGHGIYIAGLDNHKVINNTLILRKPTTTYGIYFGQSGTGYGADYGNITENYIDNYYNGIETAHCGYHNITDNVIVNSANRGISMRSNAICTIYGNHLQYNHENYGGETSFNLWDNGTHGNYWDDYSELYPLAGDNGIIYDTPYEIRAGITEDGYPLVNGFWSSPMPNSTTLITENGAYAGHVVNIKWNRALYAANYRIYVNNEYNCSTNETDIDLDFKSDGIYTVSVSVNNSIGETEKSSEITLMMNVTPEPPTITSPTSPVVTSNGYVSVTWTPVEYASKYNIYRDLEYYTDTTNTEYNVGMVVGQQNITVTAVRTGLESDHSNILNVTRYQVPDSPIIMMSSPINLNQDYLELYVWWYGGDYGNVYANDEFFCTIEQVQFPIITFTQSGTYNIFIRAANDYTESANSNTIVVNVDIGIAPAKPTLLTQSQTIDTTNLTISWSEVTGATSYDVYVNNALNGTTTNTELEIDFVTEGKYNVTVVASNSSGDSPHSDKITITVDIDTGGDPDGNNIIYIIIGAVGIVAVGGSIAVLKKKASNKNREPGLEASKELQTDSEETISDGAEEEQIDNTLESDQIDGEATDTNRYEELEEIDETTENNLVDSEENHERNSEQKAEDEDTFESNEWEE
ncbi:MAG: hypothetical protein GF364_21275, partial [Candidatus Lokiarchaeota archaeon]|nr:hypothetical protein [Candidatus Lokiarchaeota archaeon]